MQAYEDTIVALATPFGSSGVAIVRLSGCETYSIVDNFCKIAQFDQIASVPARYMERGSVWIQGRLIDQCLIVRFAAPSSYTGENVVELHLHGNMLIVQQVLDFAMVCGARLAQPGEFTRRAFLNGKLDLTQVEALAEVLAAESAHTLNIAQRQLGGELRQRFESFRKRLISFLALLELELDFVEEGYGFTSENDLYVILTDLLGYVQELIAGFRSGGFSRRGPQILLMGSPNAGKSSLFNALVGYARVIVSPLPGTTRDYVEERVYYKGLMFHIVDTAGLRITDDSIEAQGVKHSYELVSTSDMVMYLVDGYDSDNTRECQIFEEFTRCYPDTDFLKVYTKSDLYSFRSQDALYCSVFRSDSVINLLDVVANKAQARNTEASVLLSQRQLKLLEEIQQLITDLLLVTPAFTEVLSNELRRIIVPLGQLVGAVVNDEILDEVFASFCIGK